MELEEAIKKLKFMKWQYQKPPQNTVPTTYFEEIQAIETVLNRLEDLENRYLELIINGKVFKVKNDVKKLQYIDYENKEFTLEVLEKWN